MRELEIVSLHPEPGREPPDDLDLCEYVMVSAPSLAALAQVAAAIEELIGDGALRLRDVAALERLEGRTTVICHEAGDVEALHGLAAAIDGGARFSRHDLELAGVTIAPGSAALLLLLEGRWAAPLSAVAGRVGGRLGTGERIDRERLRAQLTEPDERRSDRTDLLARGPASPHLPDVRLVDPVDQMRSLADLVDRGLLTVDQYEVQRRRVIDG
ncbi:hypothetical protein EXU48_13745 [Occultella glacieicola]|uniref:SHOCT domain-containing protein n=1 Tax=Occultella glacieicola TaxID=2518684 RepID=A0ABY2E406_9MICO|nr:hypothetical protein [Occultella glacieicola]TDE92603.1 hypothetical protein EXU48_13745 [Occultella glacieicola]